ncbi:uncharacterized protein LOC117536356 isoform X2 [Gymnodraco acuticeps]|uniref:Uncharacterized protein LOC117536356 isoform X2 n=1 Tax=Gymnodraco acuticeps TaxID=8218 RepID=A0A6P8T1A6_GYMAC|nr:uncharacterized protein LOC117536356 isoform X2 [Gymnodraco acuticeps]
MRLPFFSSPNETPPTPDRSQASSTPPARANNRGHNRHSQLQSPHQLQPASLAAPGHSQRRTRHASRTEPRSETEPELQRFLKENGIHFHRNDNKARLFNLYKAYSSTTARTTTHTALPAPEPTIARGARITGRDVTGLRPPPRTQPYSPAPPGGGQVVLPSVPAHRLHENPLAHTSLHPSIPSSFLPSAVHSNPASAYLPPLAANPVATTPHPVSRRSGLPLSDPRSEQTLWSPSL